MAFAVPAVHHMMKFLPLLVLLFAPSQAMSDPTELHLTTNAQGYLTVIQGFAAQLQCILNTCSNKVQWYKDDKLLFNGTKFQKKSNLKEDSYLLEHKVTIDHAQDCVGSCSDSDSSCAQGTSCLDNACCPCVKEDYTLVLRNLTFDDSGRYRCQIANESELLEFQVEVLESGLKGGFHENISYDHSECCQKKGISSLCRAMCKPSEMKEYHFDPTSCKTDDYKNFLSCATDGGNRSHVHCCKTQLVPSFCYDFCSGDFQMLRRSHRLCLYYLPEIFDCYNRAYLPYPDPPEDVIVNALDADKLSVCWTPPKPQKSNEGFPVREYNVFYKQIPSFPFLQGGTEDFANVLRLTKENLEKKKKKIKSEEKQESLGLPLLTGDYGEIEDEDYLEPPVKGVESSTGETGKVIRRKRNLDSSELMSGYDVEVQKEVEEGERNMGSAGRRKRETWVFVTKDDQGNSSAIREFTFVNVNTTGTCVTLSDLRAATRYIVYVTTRNDYGTSVPSTRSIASTNIHTMPSNASMPDSLKCCSENGVSTYCASKMCDIKIDPPSFSFISIATTCRHEWPKVSPCIADGRNHTECCLRKGVQNDCLNICSGAPEVLGVHSVLCLNLDLTAIYQCLREGYVTHPSSPQNVTVRAVTQTSAEVTWQPPAANAHLVETYTVFIRKNEHNSPVRQIENAISPHIEMDLEPDSSYAVSVRSHSAKGVSLPSTTVLFETLPMEDRVCTAGDPLYQTNGRPVLCRDTSDDSLPCPVGYTCTSTENGDEAFCCPNQASASLSFEGCCRKLGVSPSCLSVCSHNSNIYPENCKNDFNSWIRCASDGHDHSRCCQQESLPSNCEAACRHPFFIASLDATSATLQWEDIEVVDTFEVQLFMDNAIFNRTNTTQPSIRFSNLSPASEYRARVIAFSAAGSSPPSFNITFTTANEADQDGDVPKPPSGVKIAWNRGTSVNITWAPVTQRQNGDDVGNVVEYTLFYVDSEVQNQWTTIKSNKTWIVIRDLRKDGLYSVYVSAAERVPGNRLGRSSRSSSVITLIAAPDSYGLPEPTISIEPFRSNLVYDLNDHLVINCTTPERGIDAGPAHFNIDLTAGTKFVTNDPGKLYVTAEIDATYQLETVSCAVMDTDGRQNVALMHVIVRKVAPEVRMMKDKIRAWDDLSAEVTCIVQGAAPDVRFEYQGARVYGEIKIRSHSVDSYSHTLMIKNVTGKAGEYACVASKDGDESRATATLLVSKAILPVNPRLVLDCCEEEGVRGDCLDACNIGVIRSGLNCSQYAPALLKCANDLRDHGDCCQAKQVASRCVPLCSGDSFSPDVDCSAYAATIMSCFVLGHEAVPTQPRNVMSEILADGRVKISWEPSTREDNLIFYAVYYKKHSDDSDDFKMEKTRDLSVELSNVDEKEDYDIAVTAANAYGHSPLVFVDLPASERKTSIGAYPSHSSSSSFFSLFIFVIVISAVFFGFIFFSRKNFPLALPAVFRRDEPMSRNDATVAFENPGYSNDADHEVEIRGLGSVAGSEWQSTELSAGGTGVAGAANNALSESRGMRYSKLDT